MILSTDEITVSCWYRFHQTKYTMHTWHNVWICPQMRSLSLSWSVFGTNFPSDNIYHVNMTQDTMYDILSTDELIVFELVQMSRYGGSVRLASYSANARDFLFPIPSRSLYHSSEIREIPLRRLIDFPVGCLLSVLSTQFNDNLSSVGKNLKWFYKCSSLQKNNAVLDLI